MLAAPNHFKHAKGLEWLRFTTLPEPWAATGSSPPRRAIDAPTVVLLPGFPTSSFMFRDLIHGLAEDYHVIAPDHLGFGLSDAPPVEEFDYTSTRWPSSPRGC